MKKLDLAILGCGSRAKIYAAIAATMGDRYRVVALADPSKERREAVKMAGGCPAAAEFESAEHFLLAPKCADVVVIATQDHQHREQAILSMENGYDLLLEKPIATSLADVLAVEATASRLGRRARRGRRRSANRATVSGAAHQQAARDAPRAQPCKSSRGAGAAELGSGRSSGAPKRGKASRPEVRRAAPSGAIRARAGRVHERFSSISILQQMIRRAKRLSFCSVPDRFSLTLP